MPLLRKGFFLSYEFLISIAKIIQNRAEYKYISRIFGTRKTAVFMDGRLVMSVQSILCFSWMSD